MSDDCCGRTRLELAARIKELITESARITGRLDESWLGGVLMMVDVAAGENPALDKVGNS